MISFLLLWSSLSIYYFFFLCVLKDESCNCSGFWTMTSAPEHTYAAGKYRWCTVHMNTDKSPLNRFRRGHHDKLFSCDNQFYWARSWRRFIDFNCETMKSTITRNTNKRFVVLKIDDFDRHYLLAPGEYQRIEMYWPKCDAPCTEALCTQFFGLSSPHSRFRHYAKTVRVNITYLPHFDRQMSKVTINGNNNTQQA